MRKAIFLDRDGVVNHSVVKNGKPYPPRTLSELKIIEGSAEAIRILNKSYLVFIITNQPDISRGTLTNANLNLIHSYLLKTLEINEIFTCTHDDHDKCFCRKPKPGMIVSAAKKYNIDLKKSYVVGDRWKDIEAGINAGCKTVFIDYGYSEKKPENYDHAVKTLLEFTHKLTKKDEN